MTERDDIAFGTPEAELLGAAAFDAEPPQPPAAMPKRCRARRRRRKKGRNSRWQPCRASDRSAS